MVFIFPVISDPSVPDFYITFCSKEDLDLERVRCILHKNMLVFAFPSLIIISNQMNIEFYFMTIIWASSYILSFTCI